MKSLNPGKKAVIDPRKAGNLPTAKPDQSGSQEKLKHLIARRHPKYDDTMEHWRFLEDTYEGGRAWFNSNIFRYIKEGDTEFGDRLNRCYRFNHTREVVDLLNKYLFKQNVARNVDEAPESVKNFWKHSTRSGLAVRDLARQISKKTSISGRVGIVVDMTRPTGTVVSKADEKKEQLRAYAYIVGPEQLLDYSFDDNGELNWILIQEVVRDDFDPFTSSCDQGERYRLWTKTDWQLFEETTEKKKVTVRLVDSNEHNLGVVPVILGDNIISDDEYETPSLIDDIAYLDRAVANYLSNLDAIIQDQTFSQLAMPAQNVLAGSTEERTMVEMGTKRIFLFDGAAGTPPFYLSPDPKQAQIILEVINKIINEIYHTVGLAGERTKQDNALGIDNSSGVAKAYDFERVNALLLAKADSLEVIENKIVKLVAKWHGDDKSIKDDLVSYPDSFDTRGLYDEFDIAARLMLVNAPMELRREQMKAVIEKLFPQISEETKQGLLSGLNDWPAKPELELMTDSATPSKEEPPVE